MLTDLVKAAQHKYIKRVPKAGGKGYVYYYSEGSATGRKIKEHMKEGAAFKLTHEGKTGHFHIKALNGERVRVEHDESGASVEMTRDELAALLQREHAKPKTAPAPKPKPKREKPAPKPKREEPVPEPTPIAAKYSDADKTRDLEALYKLGRNASGDKYEEALDLGRAILAGGLDAYNTLSPSAQGIIDDAAPSLFSDNLTSFSTDEYLRNAEAVIKTLIPEDIAGAAVRAYKLSPENYNNDNPLNLYTAGVTRTETLIKNTLRLAQMGGRGMEADYRKVITPDDAGERIKNIIEGTSADLDEYIKTTRERINKEINTMGEYDPAAMRALMDNLTSGPGKTKYDNRAILYSATEPDAVGAVEKKRGEYIADMEMELNRLENLINAARPAILIAAAQRAVNQYKTGGRASEKRDANTRALTAALKTAAAALGVNERADIEDAVREAARTQNLHSGQERAILAQRAQRERIKQESYLERQRARRR